MQIQAVFSNPCWRTPLSTLLDGLAGSCGHLAADRQAPSVCKFWELAKEGSGHLTLTRTGDLMPAVCSEACVFCGQRRGVSSETTVGYSSGGSEFLYAGVG